MDNTFSWVGFFREGTTASKMASMRLAKGWLAKACGFLAVSAMIRFKTSAHSTSLLGWD